RLAVGLPAGREPLAVRGAVATVELASIRAGQALANEVVDFLAERCLLRAVAPVHILSCLPLVPPSVAGCASGHLARAWNTACDVRGSVLASAGSAPAGRRSAAATSRPCTIEVRQVRVN